MSDFKQRIERLEDREKKASKGLIRLSRGVLIRNEALPLLREMAQALSEAKAENERLREGVGRALENIKDADAVGLRSDLRKAMKELEALQNDA